MGTHNHRLQLGGNVYLEIVALDSEGRAPNRTRWFGLDDQQQVRSDWDEGRRLRGCVAATQDMDFLIARHRDVFGEQVALPPENPEFFFAIPSDGSLPLGGAVPSLIDHCGHPTSMADIPNLGARLQSLSLQHPEPDKMAMLYREFSLDRPPDIARGADIRWQAMIETPSGLKVLF